MEGNIKKRHDSKKLMKLVEQVDKILLSYDPARKRGYKIQRKLYVEEGHHLLFIYNARSRWSIGEVWLDIDKERIIKIPTWGGLIKAGKENARLFKE
ncbi:MAG TPA: hypothetical protein VJH55_01365 [Candidatus Paceibacterota bacterium]